MSPIPLLWALVAFATAAQALQPVRVAVLRDDLPGVDNWLVDRAAGILRERQYPVTAIGVGDLGSAAAFNTSRYDCLVLAHSHHFPPAARENFTAFLKAGGDLVMLGPDGFLQRGSMTLPAFSRYEPYRLEAIESITAAPGEEKLFGGETRGRFEGWSAVGFTRRKAVFRPLLAARDRDGRVRGWACGLLRHFAEYPGSNWLLFGISSLDFYLTPGFAKTLDTALGGLRENAAAQEAGPTRISLRSPAPSGFVRRSTDGKHLVAPDGKRLFLVGVNYHRSLDTGEWGAQPFDDAAFEDDFRKAKEAGVNCIRLGPASRFYEDPAIVKECARKYGIYVLVILNWGTRQDYVENAERVARMYAGEPMVLGYDIQNEPAPAGVLRVEHAADAAGMASAWTEATGPLARGSGSTFPGLSGKLNTPLDAVFGQWIGRHIAAIRKHDKEHLITVGYNSPLAALPANAQLDFVSHHVYEAPLSFESVNINLSTMDRLAALWPDKPITLGEFGYSNGVIMPDGRYLDVHTSAVGEMLHWLYALAKGYDGCLKWVLTDWHWDVIGKAGDRGRATQIYEAYFGTHYYDGNPGGLGRPKPVAHGMRFLRDYVDANGPGGMIEVVRAKTSIGTGYVYRSRGGLFVGDVMFDSPELTFRAAQPANVMVMWDAKTIRVMSTADAVVSLAPGPFVPEIPPRAARLKGAHGEVHAEGDRIVIEMLEGETVEIAR
jgi:hypothetical protein